MEPRDFCLWLEGFLFAAERNLITNAIKEKLGEVDYQVDGTEFKVNVPPGLYQQWVK